MLHIKNISNVKVIEGKGTGHVRTELLNLIEKKKNNFLAGRSSISCIDQQKLTRSARTACLFISEFVVNFPVNKEQHVGLEIDMSQF